MSNIKYIVRLHRFELTKAEGYLVFELPVCVVHSWKE